MAAENSALIALADLKDLERARAHREEEAAREVAQRVRAEREAAEREAALEAARRAAAEAERVAEVQRQAALEATEMRRRVEAAEAAARTEHRVRQLELEREVQDAVRRTERQRSGRWLAVGLAVAAVASGGAFAVWRLAPEPTTASPAVAPADSNDEVRALAEELSRLERQNDDMRRSLAEAKERAEAAPTTPVAEPEPEPDAVLPTPRTRRRNTRAKPDRTRTRTETTPTVPTMKRRANPVVFDDDRSPLAGLEDE